MRFDLTTLPAGTRGADVARAVLRLWVAEVIRGGMFDVHSVRGGWSEDDDHRGQRAPAAVETS